jgi:hypothetical protein
MMASNYFGEIRCAQCPAAAEYTVGEQELCRSCADNAATTGSGSGTFLASRLSEPFRPVAALSGACDFDECALGATERRAAMQFCSEHALGHDRIMSEWEAERAVERARRVAILTKHLAAAQAAMLAWFVDASWLVYLEVGPRGLGLRLERSAATVASITLRADSNVEQLARELVAVAEVVS